MAPSLESLEVKIDTILRKMEELTALQIKVVELEDDVRVLNNKVSDLNSTVAKLNNEMTLLKEKDNDRDQQSRGNAVRLFGLAAGEEEDATDPARALIKRVYDCIVKPVLTAAKANKQLDSVPSLSNTIADAYRIKGKARQVIVGQPPPGALSHHREVRITGHQAGVSEEQEGQSPCSLCSRDSSRCQEVLGRGGPHLHHLQEDAGVGRQPGGGQGLVD